MRKFILTALLAAGSTAVFAQKSVEKAQEFLKSNKTTEARAEIDKATADPKAATNSDYWFTRAQVYSILSNNASDTALARQALVSMQRYVELQSEVKDESKQYVSSFLDKHATAASIYNDFLNAGIKNLNAKQFPLAQSNFENALQAFEYLKKAKIVNQAFDTTATLYAGYAAESASNPEKAVFYYSQIADKRVRDTTMIGVYQYLVRHYEGKKDAANMNKYLTAGKELFPKDPWWNAYELQSIKGDTPAKLAQYAERFKKDPTNMDLADLYVVELYNYIYKDSPADAVKRGQELTSVLQTVLANHPNDLRWNHILTQHLSYVSADAESAWKAAKGTKPEDVKKKQDLNKALAASYDVMLPQALKTAALYEAKPELNASEKSQYRFVINAIMVAYQYQKNNAEVAKWDAKQKAIK
ncbi:MAG: hypothetical protein EOP50_07805 [Sphingobacteriales bacterium]|nr:MAG: hypothetical protein EOP50_07805 [Sphingobacteriales bacterium]